MNQAAQIRHAAHAPVRIRPARPDDAGAIRDNHLTTFTEHADRENNFAQRPFIDPFLTRLSPPGAARFFFLIRGARTVIVAERGGAYAGHVALTRFRVWPFRPVIVIADISVAPAARRQGIGRALLSAIEAGETSAQLDAGIWRRNAASQALFESAGYTLHEFPDAPYVFATKRLRRAVAALPPTAPPAI